MLSNERMLLNERISNCKEYKIGTKGYYDTFSGMIPCIVRSIINSGSNGIIVTHKDVEIELTKTMGAYRKGEKLIVGAKDVVPKQHRIRNGYSYRILTNYKFVE